MAFKVTSNRGLGFRVPGSKSHAVTPRCLDDAKEFIQSGWSKQLDSCSLAHKILTAVAGRFESRNESRISQIIWQLALGF